MSLGEGGGVGGCDLVGFCFGGFFGGGFFFGGEGWGVWSLGGWEGGGVGVGFCGDVELCVGRWGGWG